MFEEPEILREKTEKEVETGSNDFGRPNVLNDRSASVLAEQHRRRRTRFEELQIPEMMS